MKLILIAFIATAAFAQTNVCKATAAQYKEKVTVTITDADGNTTSASIEGICAAAGLDTFTQWVADQNKCGAEPCAPKYSSPVAALLAGVVNTVVQLAERFPSRFTAPERAAVEAAEAALKVKQDALAAAAAAMQAAK